ncbi:MULTISPECIES: ArsR/SmtB family transcription factor [unclassified Sphingomonas]|jgi:DNA-binding transcriptional ArsR family regulator|uniref:ArsR/SmtB family transcription factor n=1 Tax=unclassified Sphingomonas TaxID=196159 RepID=UPI00082AA583|nr:MULTISPECIES: metalloregulator ArsR/SmtB family transcription factor [unclassified Sphingomonas]MCH4891933.1 metalloregulator ArsR/SmtB family transcription factor [Sphingomonas sp. SFZ2018-12]
MDSDDAILVFDALAQPTRLAAFRLLVRHAPDGLPAGEVSNRLNIQQNTMSTHLGILARAGLVEPRRVGRSIRYHARLDRVRALSLFLLKDCCGGDAELCRPIVAELMPCC